MAHQMLVFDSLSHMPRGTYPQEKSQIRQWYDKFARDSGKLAKKTFGHVQEGGHALRQSGESLLVGATLGAIHAEAKHGLDIMDGKIPLDATVGVVGMIAGVAMPDSGVSCDIRNAAASGLSVFAFRKTYDLIAEKKLRAGSTPGGSFGPGQKAKIAGELESGGTDADVGEDPVEAAARGL